MEDDSSSETGIVGRINLSHQGESAPDLSDKIHRLPCCIKHDGPSPVSNYFKPKSSGVEIDGLNVEEAYFRGRKLQGATIPLPPGYSGSVLAKKKVQKRKASAISEEHSNSWTTMAKFQNLTAWNHDSIPSQDDAIMRSLHWFTVSKALHQPVTAEDLESLSDAPKLK